MTLLLILFYIIGSVVSYVTTKVYFLKASSLHWTVGDRIQCIAISIIGSWVMVLVSCFLGWVLRKGNVKANW